MDKGKINLELEQRNAGRLPRGTVPSAVAVILPALVR
jgi:hypothetical protein